MENKSKLLVIVVLSIAFFIIYRKQSLCDGSAISRNSLDHKSIYLDKQNLCPNCIKAATGDEPTTLAGLQPVPSSLHAKFTENLTASRDRAGDLLNWFTINSQPTFEKYRADTDGNAVEYDDLLKLYKLGKMTKETISQVIV